ncbi:hypothetical protein HSISB1_402 [Streptococcus sp. HSISB1]|nr:hypothetical protein HSISB1_402 [Streptococcus sp. HSISB1]
MSNINFLQCFWCSYDFDNQDEQKAQHVNCWSANARFHPASHTVHLIFYLIELTVEFQNYHPICSQQPQTFWKSSIPTYPYYLLY